MRSFENYGPYVGSSSSVNSWVYAEDASSSNEENFQNHDGADVYIEEDCN